jgi:hypothetical protein
MSIDIVFQDLPLDVDDARDIPDDFLPGPIGSWEEVVAALLAAAPIDWNGPEWGRIEGERYSIEVSLGTDDPVMGFAFHARGSDLRGVDLIVADVLMALGIRALDPRRDKVIVDADTLLRPDPEADTAWLTLLESAAQRD